ncbi:MAG TPA: hypothetical protein VFZ02_06785 [Ktedonobacteraceae bacterium]
MPRAEVHQCKCPHCQQEEPHPDQELHRQMNLLLSRLDEQQRRWYVAVESHSMGTGGDRLLAQITGLDEKTIQRGLQELASELDERPEQRVRLPGGGRPRAEKRPSTRGDAGRLSAARNGG